MRRIEKILGRKKGKTETEEDKELADAVADIADAMADGNINEPEMSQEELVESLSAEIEALKIELEEKKAESDRILRELAEFAAKYPKKTIDSISREVLDSVKEGMSLDSAYASYKKKKEADESVINEVNRINAERSTGAINSAADSGYYSPDEVRKMTAYEVKKNYNLIIESMKKWN